MKYLIFKNGFYLCCVFISENMVNRQCQLCIYSRGAAVRQTPVVLTLEYLTTSPPIISLICMTQNVITRCNKQICSQWSILYDLTGGECSLRPLSMYDILYTTQSLDICCFPYRYKLECLWQMMTLIKIIISSCKI